MKSRWIALVCGASLVLALAPRLAQAQGTTSSSSGTNTSTTASNSSQLLSNSTTGGSSASGQTISAAIGSGLVTNTTTIAATSGTPSATTIPSSSNPFGPSYVNFYTLGVPSLYQGKFGAQNVAPNLTGTMGKYIYVPTPSANNGAAAAANNQVLGFSTFASGPRAPSYTTAFAESTPLILPKLATVQADARDAITRSTMLKNKASIQVGTDGAVVMLTGTVGSETERATAEGMVRMTPGVQDVLNRLVVDPSKK